LDVIVIVIVIGFSITITTHDDEKRVKKMNWNHIKTELKKEAYALGFNMVGVVAAQPSPRLAAYLRWVAQEQYGSMGYLARPDRVARRQDLQLILPGVQSMVCVGLEYYTPPLPPELAQDPSRGRISNYAWGQDYHEWMTPRLQQLADWLTAVSPPSTATKHRVYVDTGAILERDHAQQAGFGFTGKNSMLIHPRRGSFFFLGELLTTLPLPPDEFDATLLPTCGSCTRCLRACPTNAFPEPYVLDARRCISYLTIELKGWIPPELRPLLGNWVYGCDVCQEVCPFNRFAQPTAVSSFYPSDNARMAPPLLDLLALDEAAFHERFATSPIKRIKRERLVRNACVAAGNWGSDTAVSALIPLLQDSSPLVRGHSAWALGQIGAREGGTAVAHALPHETDPEAQAEMYLVSLGIGH
jgi:epoxyqueuosine reductase